MSAAVGSSVPPGGSRVGGGGRLLAALLAAWQEAACRPLNPDAMPSTFDSCSSLQLQRPSRTPAACKPPLGNHVSSATSLVAVAVAALVGSKTAVEAILYCRLVFAVHGWRPQQPEGKQGPD